MARFLIRTQDRDTLLEVGRVMLEVNVSEMDGGKYTINLYDKERGVIKLGEYTNRDCAMYVMNEIETHLVAIHEVPPTAYQSDMMTGGSFFIYYMPADYVS